MKRKAIIGGYAWGMLLLLVTFSVVAQESPKEKEFVKKWTECLRRLSAVDMENMTPKWQDSLKQVFVGFDPDAPGMEWLDTPRINGLLEYYFTICHPRLSMMERCTYLLYQVKSEKLRNGYVLPAVRQELEERGYQNDINNVLQDILLCSKTPESVAEAKQLREVYYSIREGVVAPDVALTDESGKTVRLSDFQGKVLLITAWSVTDENAAKLISTVMAKQAEFNKEVLFITVCTDGAERREAWLRFLKENRFSGKVIHLRQGDSSPSFGEVYRTIHLPRCLLVSRSGTLVSAWYPPVTHGLFSRALASQLKFMP